MQCKCWAVLAMQCNVVQFMTCSVPLCCNLHSQCECEVGRILLRLGLCHGVAVGREG